MRYIRVFSELSNQMRYATQKRVLVEIGLIKLCRPAMETNLDSVLDRIRILEKRIDERPVVQQVFVQQDAQQTEAPREEKKAAVATPDDLKKVMSGWNSIIAQTTGVFKQMLRKAKPKYDGETGDLILYVEFQDFLAQPYTENPEYTQELENIIEERTGKRIPVKMYMGSEQNHRGLVDLTVDQAIRQNINMDVVIEADPETDSEE